MEQYVAAMRHLEDAATALEACPPFDIQHSLILGTAGVVAIIECVLEAGRQRGWKEGLEPSTFSPYT